MAIMSGDSPYVHSNYYNFLANVRSNPYKELSSGDSGKEELSSTLSELKNIRDSLKSAADDFLQGKSPQQLYNELINKNPFVDIAKKVILSPQAQRYLSGEGDFYNKTEVAKVLGPELANLAIPELKGAITEQQFVGMIAQQIFGTNEIRLSNQKTNIKTNIKNKEMEKYLIEKIKQPFHSSNSRALKQLVKEAMEEAKIGKSKAKQNSVENFIKYFRQQVTQEVMNAKIPFKGDLTAELNKYLNAMEAFFRGNLKNNYTSKQASGAIAETAMAGLLTTITDSEIQIKIIGDTSEKNVWLELGEVLNKSNGVIKGEDKQSYSDWLMTYKGRTVRVQSKNYRDAIRSFINVDGIATGGGAQISLLRQENLIKLLDKLSSTSNVLGSYKREEVLYSLANELWFDMRNSLNKGKKEDKHAFNDQVLMDSLASIVINYLGIVIDKGTVINAKQSNIFYFIFGEGLIPTYRIIDGMIMALQGQMDELSKIKFTREKTSVPGLQSATSFYEQKAASVAEGLNSEGGYSDPGLLGVGTSVGAQIVNNLTFRSINLQIDAETLYKSAYVFTKK